MRPGFDSNRDNGTDTNQATNATKMKVPAVVTVATFASLDAAIRQCDKQAMSVP